MSDSVRDKIKAMRAGDHLALRDLRQLGRKLTDVLELIGEVHAKGCYVVQVGTGKRSDTDGIGLVADNLHLLSKGASKRIAKASGSKGGAPRRYFANDRDEATWRNVTRYATDEIAAAKIGVSVPTLWRRYGKSGRSKTGRPKKQPKAR